MNGVSISPLMVAEPISGYNIGTMTEERWVEVLVDNPGVATDDSAQPPVPGIRAEEEKLYTYRVPDGLEVKAGDILSVPFASQILGGVAIRLLRQPPTNVAVNRIRDIEDVVAKEFFRDSYWKLMERVSEYYFTPLIKVIRTALPPGLLGRSQSRIRLKPENIPNGAEVFLDSAAREILQILKTQQNGDYSIKFLRPKVRGFNRGKKQLLQRGWIESYLELPRHSRPKTKPAVTLLEDGSYLELTKRQQEILKVLRDNRGDLWLSELMEICKTTLPTLKTLQQKGCIAIQDREILRKEQSPDIAADRAKTLTPDQTQALETIVSLNGFATVLLHGVTGSGKTEVYLQAIDPIIQQGKSALVLVPEIGLTPQLTDRFRARFGSKVDVYHSALSQGERYDTWRQMLVKEPQIIIGTRSAVFAPLPNLGLIILDEEHDSSFKQDSPIPTYHARKVATWRAELENCPLVLGSATPSLESWIDSNSQLPHSVETRLIASLPNRVNSRPLPPVEVVDMRQELQQGNRSIFSRKLQAALQELEERQQQGILFIHRRGHSTFVSCRSCGFVMECPNCDVSLTYHYHEGEEAQLLQCHYCNYTQIQPKSCPECGSPYLKFFGSGTQRVEQELAKQFPNLTSIRFDSDTTRHKGAHRDLLTKFVNGEANLLIGTQMLTKGLDIPQVTLVGVIAADGLLHLSDYRASERAFQTLTQVAGRCGRGDDPGKVIIQTYTPEHPVIEAVEKHDYESFIQVELEQREALNYPPYGRLILLRLSSVDAIEVQNAAQIIAVSLSSGEGYEILGPAPATILRVANRFRWQILLKFEPNVLPKMPDWEQVRQICPSSVSMTIDVDPLNMM
ncbi:MAG: primosomal protein N' [Scytonematopsis contorta HA4267-MV1]|jgi:primosomal protein N' (replication factor Y)|nr:primosomal protein N' [Scytonematopsis contorta HA4267-MV1]